MELGIYAGARSLAFGRIGKPLRSHHVVGSGGARNRGDPHSHRGSDFRRHSFFFLRTLIFAFGRRGHASAGALCSRISVLLATSAEARTRQPSRKAGCARLGQSIRESNRSLPPSPRDFDSDQQLLWTGSGGTHGTGTTTTGVLKNIPGCWCWC